VWLDEKSIQGAGNLPDRFAARRAYIGAMTGPVSEIPNQTTRIHININNVIYKPGLETDFPEALAQFLCDQGLMGGPNVRLQMAIEPPTPSDDSQP
jgi:hypothetical protein